MILIFMNYVPVPAGGGVLYLVYLSYINFYYSGQLKTPIVLSIAHGSNLACVFILIKQQFIRASEFGMKIVIQD